jgi:hypothetical protein
VTLVNAVLEAEWPPETGHRIYLMTDYTSSSVWWETGGMVGLDDLPLTDATKSALEAWSNQMFVALNASTGHGPPIDEDEHQSYMDAEGARLLRIVRAELGDAYEVGQAKFQDGRKRIDWGPGRSDTIFPAWDWEDEDADSPATPPERRTEG